MLPFAPAETSLRRSPQFLPRKSRTSVRIPEVSRFTSWMAITSNRRTTSAMQARARRFRLGSAGFSVHCGWILLKPRMFQVPMRRL